MRLFEELNNKAVAAFEVQDYDAALKYHDDSIVSAKKLPRSIVSVETIAMLHANKGYTLLAISAYDHALVQFSLANRYSHNDENDWSLFLCHANLRNMKKAKQFHHTRYGDTRSAPTKVRFPKLPIPLVKKVSDIKDKKLLILNEQGLGDEILFFSGIRKLASMCSSIHLQVYSETYSLFESQLPDNVTLFADRSFYIDFVNKFDCYSTTGDMFFYSLEDENCYGYNEPLVLPQSYEASNGRGFCWQANVNSPNANKRSIDPSYLETHYKIYGLNQSLQYNIKCPEWMKPLPAVESLYDTACVMASLESIVTVDTSIAHLAGALHIPTILLINNHFDWRWKQQKHNGYSKFYPTVKVVNI